VRNYVFIDESIRDSYVMAAVIVPINRLGEYRKAMAGLRTKGSLAFHMSQEKAGHRRASLECLLGLDEVECLFAKSFLRNRSMAREEALLAIIQHLEAKREWNLVLDRTTEQDHDFRVIVQVRKDLQLDLQVVHSTRYEDTGLWGCDILAWAIDSKEMKDLIRLGSVQNLSPR
jgi:hypothetical protein